MVMMKNSVMMATSLLLLSTLVLQTYANTYEPDECCFRYSSKEKVIKKRVKEFKDTDSLCPMEGIVFKMKGGRTLCVDPTQQWVKDIIEVLERKAGKNATPTPSQ